MNEHDQGRIAAALNQARPDWPVRQLLTLLRTPSLADRPRRDVFVALAWVASEPASSSPYRVLESGPWWLAAGVEGATTGVREPYDQAEFCSTCNVPRRRHVSTDHQFLSELDRKRHAAATPVDTASAREYARQAVGDAKAVTPGPPAAPRPPGSPADPASALRKAEAHAQRKRTTDLPDAEVDRLRGLYDTGEVE